MVRRVEHFLEVGAFGVRAHGAADGEAVFEESTGDPGADEPGSAFEDAELDLTV